MTTVKSFQQTVWDYYLNQARDLPWRLPEQDGSFDSYKILVSEIMLQQTQVSRVVPKYEQFLKRFPNLESLAQASLGDVLKVWSGLGYNRRAKYLHQAAIHMAGKPQPWQYEELVALPGIGPNTANAVLVYAYNQPVLFIETNIRTVFIHHFFSEQSGVSDQDILLKLEQTLPSADYRQWFWALMDYGAHLKTTAGNAARASKHYTKQSKFEGSSRQLRGKIIRLLTKRSRNGRDLLSLLDDPRATQILHDLQAEGLIIKDARQYRLA